MELSIVMPCLNEAQTLADCIRDARMGAESSGADGYEIIVADNGSEDGSPAIAQASGARVVQVPIKGYGAALRGGISAANGRFVLMGDSDSSYDFTEAPRFLEQLRKGYLLAMGTRIKGLVHPGAMPALHRWVGNPILTSIGNALFGSRLSDYHCGMRGFDREAIKALNLRTEGMEFASEMVIRAALAKYPTCEVSITYRPAGRSRPPHLRTWRDGWRHLRFMLLYSPKWVMLYPGLALAAAGGVASVRLVLGPMSVGRITFDVHTLLVSTTATLVGTLLVLLALTARSYASRAGLLPANPSLERVLERYSLGLGLAAGVLLVGCGLGLYGVGLVLWGEASFGPIENIQRTLRWMIGGTTLIGLGAEVFFGSFVLSLLGMR
jgi:hypothetical protein